MDKFKAHILLVDDDEGIRSLVKKYLNENNFLVTTADSAENASEKVKIIKFDLIILDIMMSGKSGLDFIKDHKKDLDTPIILLTAKGEASERVEGLELGADDYLAKPFEPKELILRIRNILTKTIKTDQKRIIEFENVKIDLNKLLIHKDKKEFKINNTEKIILEKMINNPGNIFSRESIGQLINLDKERSIDQLDTIMIETRSGQIPISNFVEKKPKQNVSFIRRYDARNAMYIKANVEQGIIAANKVDQIQNWITDQNYPSYIDVAFGGENEEQTESMKFVTQAFIISLLIMAALLVTQFNSFYQSFIILTAVIMSTAGVFFGLLLFNQPFSAIMHGVGVVSLAGIVVNNNIILIDAFNFVREKDTDNLFNSVLKACAQRLRPIFLTTITTMLGLIPLALNYSIDPLARTIEYDSNVSGFWTPLAQCIVYGLSFSAFLTLIVTPCLLILPSHVRSLMKTSSKQTVEV